MKFAFDHFADEYDRFRPPYPEGMLAALGEAVSGLHVTTTDAPKKHGAAGIILDVGAGTGILSRQMASRGWDVVALEPSYSMLQVAGAIDARQGRTGQPVRMIAAQAECTPVRDESVDVITVAQAFHWMNPPLALAEFARVLRPRGSLALAWNNRNPDVHPIVDAFEDLIRKYNPAHVREYRRQNWESKIAETGRFGSAVYERFDWTWVLSVEDFIGFSRTISYVRNTIPKRRLSDFARDLADLCRSMFDKESCRIPMWTDLWMARRCL